MGDPYIFTELKVMAAEAELPNMPSASIYILVELAKSRPFFYYLRIIIGYISAKNIRNPKKIFWSRIRDFLIIIFFFYEIK